MQKYVMPEIGVFIENATGGSREYKRKIKSIIGELPITNFQPKKLELRPHNQFSPYLEACCLRVSASVSYQRAAEDIEYLTGVKVSKSVQQRLGRVIN